MFVCLQFNNSVCLPYHRVAMSLHVFITSICVFVHLFEVLVILILRPNCKVLLSEFSDKLSFIPGDVICQLFVVSL